VPGLSTSSDSSDGATNVDDGRLEESDLFNFYEPMHVSLPETQFSDNSGDEPTAELAHRTTSMPLSHNHFIGR
jgi:hypothetical protein